jgi:hypothetical protein
MDGPSLPLACILGFLISDMKRTEKRREEKRGKEIVCSKRILHPTWNC